jgi:hypothetical protein
VRRLLPLLGALACAPAGRELTQNLSAAWDACDPGSLSQRAAENGLQLVFEPCGAADLRDGAWSPDGRTLYFALSGQGYQMEGRGQSVSALATGPLRPGAVWLDNTNVALLEEVDGDTQITVVREGVVQGRHPLDLGEPRRLGRAPTPGALWVWSGPEDGPFIAYPFRLADDTLLPALPAESPSDMRLGHPHPQGDWIVYEKAGAPQPRIDPRAGARQSDFLRRLPAEATAPLRPPTLLFVHQSSGTTFRWEAVQGSAFAWYGPGGAWASFQLWGFDGEQSRTNLVLTDLGPRLRALAEGQPVPGFVPSP